MVSPKRVERAVPGRGYYGEQDVTPRFTKIPWLEKGQRRVTNRRSTLNYGNFAHCDPIGECTPQAAKAFDSKPIAGGFPYRKGNPMRWKIGDEVQLKSSGPNMTVFDFSEEDVKCRWFDKSGTLHDKTFASKTLVEAESSRLTINVNLGDDPPQASK